MVSTTVPAATAQKQEEKPLDALFDDDDAFADPKSARRLNLVLGAYDDPWQDLKNPQVMIMYYRHLLPWKSMFTWLNKSHLASRQFTHREFAFTLPNDVYVRYNSFTTYQDLQREVIRLNPTRFEIGPVYSFRPRDRKTITKTQFRPVARELVFDIDLTDYDDIRTCCNDKAICSRCWKFIAMAVPVLESILRSDFGFKHLLWVYSGRRGIHCWVSDPAAMNLTDDQRRAIVNYIEIVKGGASSDRRVELGRRPLHPSISRSVDILKRHFTESVLTDQDAYRATPKWQSLLRYLPDPDIASRLSDQWSTTSVSSLQKWKDLLKTVKEKSAMENALTDIVLSATYPRIDGEVSKHMNHLLKAPFVIHPSTGKVCVPVDPDKIDSFDINTVPDVRDLLRELDSTDADKKVKTESTSGDPQSAGGGAWQRTKLRPFVEHFERHCKAILKDALEAKKVKDESTMEF